MGKVSHITSIKSSLTVLEGLQSLEEDLERDGATVLCLRVKDDDVDDVDEGHDTKYWFKVSLLLVGLILAPKL